MGLRFRRSVRFAPGIRLNFSRSGVSASVGVRGAHVTVGHGNVRESVGIPGSGLSYTEVQRARGSGSLLGILVVLAVLAAFLIKL